VVAQFLQAAGGGPVSTDCWWWPCLYRLLVVALSQHVAMYKRGPPPAAFTGCRRCPRLYRLLGGGPVS